MSKSIYDEALEVLLNTGTEFISIPCNPIGEENSDMIHLRDVTETYETNMHEVVKALEQAQKQEKLLKLYQELSKLIVAVPLFEGSKMICYKTKYRSDIKYTNILNKIKELENE